MKSNFIYYILYQEKESFMKRILTLLLALGIIPVIVDDSFTQRDQIRADKKALGLSACTIARELNISDTTVYKTIYGTQHKQLPRIIKFIEDKKAERNFHV